MYTVGIDNNDNTILRIGDEGYVSTLTMSYSGVLQLIRLLEATLPEYMTEEETK